MGIAILGGSSQLGFIGTIQTLPALIGGGPGAGLTLSNTGDFSGVGSSSGNWVLPTAYAAQWEVMLTVLSGFGFSGSATGSYLSLGTTRAWTALGDTDGRFTFREIATGAVRSTQDITFQP